MAARPAYPGQFKVGRWRCHQAYSPVQPFATTGPFPIGALPIGALPMGALPTTGFGGGGCRVGRSAASAAPPVAIVDTTTQIKCFTPNAPLIAHDSF
jgi:hypothetical protein